MSPVSVDEVQQRVKALAPVFQKLFKLSGSPGLSIGVILNDESIYTSHLGRRSVESSDPVDDDTLYNIVSLTKVISAGVVASLVHDGVLDWDTPIRKYLPQFRREDELGQNATLVDLFANTSGISAQTTFWGSMRNEYLLKKEDIVPVACAVDAVRPFRKGFVYSNWGYGLITAVIEEVTGKTFSVCTEERIFRPLGMMRSAATFPKTDNVADLHVVAPSEPPFILHWHPGWTDETGFSAGGGARSSVKELSVLYKSILQSYRHQLANNVDSTSGSPFKYMRKIFSPHAAVYDAPKEKLGYCLGTYRTQLPGNLSVSNINNILLGKKNRWLFGHKSAGVEIFHQNGARPGAFGAAHLVPSANAAVFALANSLPLFDVTDYISQLITAIILNETELPDYVKLAEAMVKSNGALYGNINKFLDMGRTGEPASYELQAYEGRYYPKSTSLFYFTVRKNGDGKLELTCLDRPLTKYVLEHYNGNSFYWPPDRAQEARDAIWPFLPPSGRILHFHSDDNSHVTRFEYHHDFSSREPEVFHKASSETSARL